MQIHRQLEIGDMSQNEEQRLETHFTRMIQNPALRAELEHIEWVAHNPGPTMFQTFGKPVLLFSIPAAIIMLLLGVK